MQANSKSSMPAAAVHHDQILQITAFALMALGLAIVFSSSNVMAQSQYNDAYYFIKRQGIYALLGVGALLLGRSIDYHRYKKHVYLILFLCLLGLLLVFVPFIGAKVRGAARWIRLGPFTVQPSEFAKIGMALFLAYSLSQKQEKMKYFAIGFLPHMLVAGVFIALIGREPDFGTAVTLGAIVFVMLFVGGTRVTQLLLALAAAVPAGAYMVMKDPKKWARFLSFIDPWKHGQDVGYQLKHSLLAIGSGGLLGMGPGQSRAKLFYLPDAHTDFILSILTEELGFWGFLLVLILFGIIVSRGIWISLRAPDSFGSYLALGLTLVIGLPAIINMGVVSGIFPTKGLSLPFLSYGGSCLMANLLAVGILLNISSQIKRVDKSGAPVVTRTPAGNGLNGKRD